MSLSLSRDFLAILDMKELMQCVECWHVSCLPSVSSFKSFVSRQAQCSTDPSFYIVISFFPDLLPFKRLLCLCGYLPVFCLSACLRACRVYLLLPSRFFCSSRIWTSVQEGPIVSVSGHLTSSAGYTCNIDTTANDFALLRRLYRKDSFIWNISKWCSDFPRSILATGVS